MRASWIRSILLLGFGCLATTGRAADTGLNDLLRRLPDSTNAVIVADVDGLRKAVGAGPETALVSPGLPFVASTFVLGIHIDLADRRHIWSIGVCQLRRPVLIEDLAKAEEEPVDNLAGYSIVSSARNVYFAALGKNLLGVNLLGVRTPANRVDMKKWLAFQKTNQLPALSPYLLKAVAPEDPALMVLALDLDDSMDPTAVRRGLNASQILASRKKVNYEAVGKMLARASGVTFTVRAGEPLTGELVVDFETTTEAIRPFAKSLLLEILDNNELDLPEFDDWKPVLKERSVGIRGPLSLNGLRKIGSLIKTPAPAPEAADMGSYSSLSPEERTIVASKKYFQNVTQILSDLKADKTRNVKNQASWYDTFAGQIDKLPILDVDQDLIQYAASISQALRAMGASLKGVDLQSGYLQRQKTVGQVYQAPQYTGNYNFYGPYGGYYGGWGATAANNAALYRSGTAGGVTTVNNFDAIHKQQDALVTKGNAARVVLWQQIDNETAAIRRKMTQKYRTEF